MSSRWSWLRRVAPIGVALWWVSAALAAPDPSPPAAAPPPPSSVSISWADIVAAVDRHPAIAAGRSGVAASRAGVRAARTAPNPSVSAAVSRANPADGAAGNEWSLELSLPLGWLAARRPLVNAAQAELSRSEAEAESLRREALAELRGLFWRVAVDQSRVETLERLAEEDRALARSVRTRVDRGDARPVELTLVEMEREKVEAELVTARLMLSGSREQLRVWLNLPAGSSLTVEADLDKLPAVFDRETAVARSRQNPRLLAARAEVDGRRAELETERLGRLPEVSLEPFIEEELDVQRQGVGVTADLPLWDWNQARVAQTGARLDAAQAQLETVEREIEIAAIEAQASCEAEVTMAGRWRDEVLPRAASVAAVMERAWELGDASLADVIDARRSRFVSRDQYLNNLARAHSECGRLYAVIGEEAP